MATHAMNIYPTSFTEIPLLSTEISRRAKYGRSDGRPENISLLSPVVDAKAKKEDHETLYFTHFSSVTEDEWMKLLLRPLTVAQQR